MRNLFLLQVLAVGLLAELWTQKKAAAYLDITDRSVRNLIARGELTGYRVAGLRAVRLDSEEVRKLLRAVPTALPRARRAAGPARVPFGARARVVQAITDAEGHVVGRVPLSAAAKAESTGGDQ